MSKPLTVFGMKITRTGALKCHIEENIFNKAEKVANKEGKTVEEYFKEYLTTKLEERLEEIKNKSRKAC